MHTTTIGVDLAKSVFQLSIANQAGRIVTRKRLSRSQFDRFLSNHPPSSVVMESCASAHYWARRAVQSGHTPQLLHAAYVRPYVRRNKTDAADADALCRASQDEDIKPAAVKSEDHQAIQGLHRIRAQWQKTRTQRISLVRSLLTEFGLTSRRGTTQLRSRLRCHTEQVPETLRCALIPVLDEISALEDKIKQLDRELEVIGKQHPVVQRLLSIPGIGLITATALVAAVPDIHRFQRARQFSSWLGITPREYSSGNSRYLGSITKRGDRYLRTQLINGARSALLSAHRKPTGQRTTLQQWALDLESRSQHNTAAVALANKMARIVWCVWTREAEYQAS